MSGFLLDTDCISEPVSPKPEAMREARRYISESAPNHGNYTACLTDYNNDPAITFADIQKLLQAVEERIAKHQ